MSYMRLCPVPQRATFSRQGAVTRPGVQSGFEAFDFVTGVELSATFAQLVQLCPALGQFPASPALTTEQHPDQRNHEHCDNSLKPWGHH
ncbi:hypothetical protein [Pseudomonas sp. MWU13-2100]|uniref:hypothetical protein n=1 Tax=Pseudomonas sp. MWU13-2100 TaxID=2935075 RepID=UPI002010B88D|nr:hypothetical protein [Pseudomonas sp. MWU13-2100]